MKTDRPDEKRPIDPSWENRAIDHPDERAFIQATHDCILAFEKEPFDRLCRRLREIERRFATSMNDRARDHLIVRRVIAQLTLTAALASEQPVGACEGYFVDALALGWANLAEKVNTVHAFGAYCIRHGRRDVARRHIDPVLLQLRAERERTQAEWCDASRTSLERLLRSRPRRT